MCLELWAIAALKTGEAIDDAWTEDAIEASANLSEKETWAITGQALGQNLSEPDVKRARRPNTADRSSFELLPNGPGPARLRVQGRRLIRPRLRPRPRSAGHRRGCRRRELIALIDIADGVTEELLSPMRTADELKPGQARSVQVGPENAGHSSCAMFQNGMYPIDAVADSDGFDPFLQLYRQPGVRLVEIASDDDESEKPRDAHRCASGRHRGIPRCRERVLRPFRFGHPVRRPRGERLKSRRAIRRDKADAALPPPRR